MLRRLIAPWRLAGRVQTIAVELGKLLREHVELEAVLLEELDEHRMYVARELSELRDKCATLERENAIVTRLYEELVMRVSGVERARSGTRERVP